MDEIFQTITGTYHKSAQTEYRPEVSGTKPAPCCCTVE